MPCLVSNNVTFVTVVAVTTYELLQVRYRSINTVGQLREPFNVIRRHSVVLPLMFEMQSIYGANVVFCSIYTFCIQFKTRFSNSLRDKEKQVVETGNTL